MQDLSFFIKRLLGGWDLCNEAKKNFWSVFERCLKTIKKSSKNACFFGKSLFSEKHKFFRKLFVRKLMFSYKLSAINSFMVNF
jgi:hypothetical protein